MKLILLFIGLIGTPSLWAADLAVEDAEVQGVYTAMDALRAVDNSCFNALDCRSIAVGSRSCGGPSAYFVVSANNPHMEALKVLADLTTHMERNLSVKHMLVSVCSMIMAPALACQNQQCVPK